MANKTEQSLDIQKQEELIVKDNILKRIPELEKSNLMVKKIEDGVFASDQN